jgi:CheY-like chemotaxis protein
MQTSDTRCVLVVAESAAIGKALADAIEGTGHIVRQVDNAREAFTVALASQPRAVCVDLGLPMSSAYDVVVRIAAACGGKRPLLVAVASPGVAVDQDKARQGFDFVVDVDAPWALRDLLGPPEHQTAMPKRSQTSATS